MSNINLYRADLSSAKTIQTILSGAPRYQESTQGVELQPGAGESVLTALPPGCDVDQKHVLIIERDGDPIGIVDMIQGYPEVGVAYIGLLLLIEKVQGEGLGKQSYFEVEKYITGLGGVNKIRLSYVKSNPVERFWEKMGFDLTGEERPYNNESVCSSSVLMEKYLS